MSFFFLQIRILLQKRSMSFKMAFQFDLSKIEKSVEEPRSVNEINGVIEDIGNELEGLFMYLILKFKFKNPSSMSSYIYS